MGKPAKRQPSTPAPIIQPAREISFVGMDLPEIKVSLGLPPGASLAQVKRAAEIQAGIRRPRKSKKITLTEAQREAAKKAKKEATKKKREAKKKWHESIGIPVGGRTKMTKEEKKARRSQKGKDKRKETKEMRKWAKDNIATLEQSGIKVPDWMKKLK